MTQPIVASLPHDISRVIIVHGYAASPAAHWFPWLGTELRARGIAVVVTPLPEPNEPDSATWEAAVGKSLGAPDERTWVVTHSLGGITTLRHLATLTGDWTLGGMVLVSPFTGALPVLPELDEYLHRDVSVEGLVSRIRGRVAIRSDDDPFVSPAASDELAERMQASVVVVPRAGHFLGENGWTSLPAVLDALRV